MEKAENRNPKKKNDVLSVILKAPFFKRRFWISSNTAYWLRRRSFVLRISHALLHILCILIIAASGCDLFSTRTPEEPKSRQSSWIPPLSPNQAVLNMQNAVYERNVENYIQCLADTAFFRRSFIFIPDPQAASIHPELFSSWSREKERMVMLQLFALVPANAASFLVLEEEAWSIIGAEEAVYTARYRLEVHHNQPNLDTVYRGHLNWEMAPDSRGHWVIVKWTDNGVDTARSWSLLKGQLGG